jgi:GDP-L-fucose synthase
VVWGSGRQQRDFIHIEDVVSAVFATFDQLEPGEALNLGSGEGTSFFELAELVIQKAGRSTEVINDASKPEGVFARVADCERMFKYYRPSVSLEKGVEMVLEHQRRVGGA